MILSRDLELKGYPGRAWGTESVYTRMLRPEYRSPYWYIPLHSRSVTLPTWRSHAYKSSGMGVWSGLSSTKAAFEESL